MACAVTTVRSLFGGGGNAAVANATLLIGLPGAGKTALFQQVQSVQHR
jgi:predicted ATP-dependent serine protease